MDRGGIDKKTRYERIERGIRKDRRTGRYQANRSELGKRTWAEFKSLRDARNWRRGLDRLGGLGERNKGDGLTESYLEVNGRNMTLTLGELWEMFKEYRFPKLALSTREVYQTLSSFFSGLKDKRIAEINAEVIEELVRRQKERAVALKAKRCSFDEDLKRLKTLFNWYIENFDETFRQPVRKRHFDLGYIREKTQKEKKMSPAEVLAFFNSLDPFWRDVAITQFYLAARIQEVAGLTVGSVDISKRQLMIKDVVVWSRKNKQVVDIRSMPKNNEVRFCFINDELLEILQRNIGNLPPGTKFIFHRGGAPFKYRDAQSHYNKALKRAGLYGRFSSTHIMRHSMATITREVTGSLETTQAVTGHKDQRLVQHYSRVPEHAQKQAVLAVEKLLRLRRNSG